MEYRCVQCGFPIKTPYVQYSPGNFRLMKCEKCRAVADEYIECVVLILLIDLILHKPIAYRHLLYNVLNEETIVEFEVFFSGNQLSVFFFWMLILVDVFLGNCVCSNFCLCSKDTACYITRHPKVWDFPSSVIFIVDLFVLSSKYSGT